MPHLYDLISGEIMFILSIHVKNFFRKRSPWEIFSYELPYIIKPVSPQALAEVLEKWLPKNDNK